MTWPADIEPGTAVELGMRSMMNILGVFVSCDGSVVRLSLGAMTARIDIADVSNVWTGPPVDRDVAQAAKAWR